MGIITIQPGQPGQGMGYDVHQPIPYPFHIDTETGDCIRGRGTHELGDAPLGMPWRLIGFQRGTKQRLEFLFADFVHNPQKAVGRRPVFSDGRGGIFNLTEPITGVRSHEQKASVQ